MWLRPGSARLFGSVTSSEPTPLGVDSGEGIYRLCSGIARFSGVLGKREGGGLGDFEVLRVDMQVCRRNSRSSVRALNVYD